MLEIKQTKKYRVARYPIGIYRKNKSNIPLAKLKYGSLPLLALFILESCDNNGGTIIGIPAVDFVTEETARAIINQVFTDNNISLTSDVGYHLYYGQNDSSVINLDGFNDSLGVGYEYMSEEDYQSINQNEFEAIDSIPYIELIHGQDKVSDYKTILENITQEFIDSLKARGVI